MGMDIISIADRPNRNIWWFGQFKTRNIFSIYERLAMLVTYKGNSISFFSELSFL